jgi:hypothetical protein
MAQTDVSRPLLDRAFAAGALTTIATGGALIGLGLRENEASRVFRLVGRGLLEQLGIGGVSAPLTSVALGYLHHLLIAACWGVVLAVLVLRPRRVQTRLLLSVVAAVLYGALSLTVLPPTLRIGHAVTSNAPGAVAISVALLLALLGAVWVDATESDD